MSYLSSPRRICPARNLVGILLAWAMFAATPLLGAGQCGSCGIASPAPCACEGVPPRPLTFDAHPPQPSPTGEIPAGEDPLLIQPGLGDPGAAGPTADGPLLASSFGAAAGSFSAAPHMIGDLFGTPGGSTIVGRQFVCTGVNLGNRQLFCPDDDLTFVHENNLLFDQFGIDTNGDGLVDFLPNLVEDGSVNNFSDTPGGNNGPYFGVANSFRQNTSTLEQEIDTADVYREIVVDAPSPGTGLLLGRLKIAENNSPMPRDRVFVNYSYFSNTPLFPGGVNVNRVTPGFERTFHNGQMSLEFRFPFGTTLDNDIIADGVTSTDKLLFGNAMVVYKTLLLTGENWALSGGMAVTLPTARDIRVGLADGSTLLQIRNQSVHLSPYVAYLGAPTERFFFQAFLQAEFDTHGNPVDAQGTGGTLRNMGRVNDTNYLYFDIGAGYYVYRNRFDRLITSLSPVAELHWNKTLQPTDTIRRGGVQIGNFAQNVDVLNGVLGLNMTVGQNTIVTAGYAAPIAAGDNKQFDGEARLLVNHLFGSN
jgi:hypothetical protein